MQTFALAPSPFARHPDARRADGGVVTEPAAGSSVGGADPAAAHADVLAERAAAGDADAVTALVRRHLPAAHAPAPAALFDAADAGDVCQAVFAALLPRLDECGPAGMFRAWLLRSVRNRAVSVRRWRRVRDAAPLGTGPGELDVAAAGESPHAAAERADLRARLGTALSALPDA